MTGDAPKRKPGAAPQVEPEHYRGREYDSLERFVSYWHQADLVLSSPCRRVLEIGVGNGFLVRYLERRGVEMASCDVDPRLRPSATADLAKGLPFRDAEFEGVACFEVLEHLPWERVPGALDELGRVAGRNVFLSVPDVTPHYHVSFALPLVGTWRSTFTIPWTRAIPWRRPSEHRFDGEHHWELGKAGYSAGKFRDLLVERFDIRRDFRSSHFPFHHFFLLTLRHGR